MHDSKHIYSESPFPKHMLTVGELSYESESHLMKDTLSYRFNKQFISQIFTVLNRYLNLFFISK